MTTKCLIRVKYGQRFQVFVRYLSEAEAKEAAFQLVSLIQEMQGPDELSDAELKRVKADLPVAMQQFKTLTGIDWTRIQLNKKLKKSWPQTAPLLEWRDQAKLDEVSSDWPLPTTADDIVLADGIKPVLGRSLLLVGRGACDVDVDRTWIRDQLDLLLFGCTRELVQRGNSSDWQTQTQADKCSEAHAISSITLFVPAGVLESGLCLLDMPGTNEKNAMSEMQTKQGMDESDVLMLLTARNLSADQATLDVLTQSPFLRDAIALSRAPLDDAASAGLASVSLSACLPVPAFGQLVHVHCSEKSRPVTAKKLFDQLIATYEDVPVTSDMHNVLAKSKKEIRQTLMAVFSSQRAAAQVAAAAHDSDDDEEPFELTAQQQADFEAAVGKCTQLAVYPSLFTSVALNGEEALGLPAPSDENRARLLGATGLGRLLGKLRNTGVRQAAYMLEQICSTGQPSTRNDNAVQELSASEDDDGYDCKMNAQGEPAAAASASAASASSSSSAAPVVQPLIQGPIPRLLRDLRSVLADRRESEPSRVQDLKVIAEKAVALCLRPKKDAATSAEPYRAEAQKLCSALRKDAAKIVVKWFRDIWVRDAPQAIQLAQADIEDKGRGLQNSNKRSVLAPYMSGLTPAFKCASRSFGIRCRGHTCTTSWCRCSTRASSSSARMCPSCSANGRWICLAPVLEAVHTFKLCVRACYPHLAPNGPVRCTRCCSASGVPKAVRRHAIRWLRISCSSSFARMRGKPSSGISTTTRRSW